MSLSPFTDFLFTVCIILKGTVLSHFINFLFAVCIMILEKDESDMEEGVAEDKIIMVRYHGIVNEEADVTAEKFGTTLKPE